MVSVAKPWLICGYHGLTTVTILNLYLLFYIIINSLYIQCIYYIYTVYILYIYIYYLFYFFYSETMVNFCKGSCKSRQLK